MAASLPVPQPLVILIPVFNDWAAAALLLPLLDHELMQAALRGRVVLVDDGSTTPLSNECSGIPLRAIEAIDVLTLRRNLGHQRAIAIGLTYLEQRGAPDVTVVMDGDGEDDPADVPRLLARLEAEPIPAIVFAARRKRSEGLVFRAFYWLYRTVHLLLTGIPVNVGNFSAVPHAALRRLVAVSELWNHYAAAVFRARIHRCSIPTERATRLAGNPTMNFVALVSHGLSALAVHGELVGVRLLIATLFPLLLVILAVVTVVGIRAFTDLAIPGWATTAGGLSLVLLTQLLVLAGLFTMFTLNSRVGANFMPLRDYVYYIDGEARTVASWSRASVEGDQPPPARTDVGGAGSTHAS